MLAERPAVRIVPPPLHPTQLAVWEDDTRFQVLACGRRWGKTRLGVLRCVATAVRGGVAWWVGPSFPTASVGWRVLQRLASQIPGSEPSRMERIVSFPSGGWLQVKSADNPDSLRGEGLDFVVVDECAFVQEAAWTEALRPALSDRMGRALFISTPKGRNWFWMAHQRGEDAREREWQAWRFPTSANPYINPVEIENARQQLPERVFAQEYEAIFLDDAGGIFRKVRQAATATPQEGPVEGHRYVMGVDWGKIADFSVLCLVDATTKEVVHLDRFNKIDYTVQKGRLLALYEKFRPDQVYAEQNSMGVPLVEDLQRMSVPVVPFLTTNASKLKVIDALALAFEREELRIPDDPTLLGELLAYEAERLPSGTLRYSAPEGQHDDCVMALALAWEGAQASPVAWY